MPRMMGLHLGYPELMCRIYQDRLTAVKSGGTGWREDEKPGSAELLNRAHWTTWHTPATLPQGGSPSRDHGDNLSVQGDAQHAQLWGKGYYL